MPRSRSTYAHTLAAIPRLTVLPLLALSACIEGDEPLEAAASSNPGKDLEINPR